MSMVPVTKAVEGLDLVTAAPEQPILRPTPAARPLGVRTWPRTWFDRIEAFISRLSVRDNFWHRICSFIWLPYAFFSGIRMKKLDVNTFSAILPFNRFNRNWYRAMAGAALLGNSEVAGGMYVFGVCGSDYIVVCKHMEYRFLRPCFGPAVYRIKPCQDIHSLLATGGEFNLTVDMDIFQQVSKGAKEERRVGKSIATFHVTPKAHLKAKTRA